MRGARVAGLLGFVGCALSGGAPLAITAARAAELEARGPSECPDSAELGFRVERNVGVPLAQAPAVKFVVEMRHAANTYAARLVVSGASATESKQRELSAASCGELADAVVVAMTLALGAAAQPAAAATGATHSAEPVATPPLQTAPSSAPAVAAAPVSDAAVAEPTEEAAASPLRPALSLAVLGDVGSLPAPALGAALGVQLSWQRLQLRALGTLLFEQHAEVGDGPGRPPGADLQLWTAALSGCTTALGGQRLGVTLPVCLGFELGRLSGTGTDVLEPRSGSALWAAARADVGALWCPGEGPLCLTGTLTAAAPLTRSRFALAEIGTVYRPSPVVGRLSLGAIVGFD